MANPHPTFEVSQAAGTHGEEQVISAPGHRLPPTRRYKQNFICTQTAKTFTAVLRVL